MSKNTKNGYQLYGKKCDEYYTSKEHIDLIMPYINDYVKRRKVYCPFSSEESEFVKYFKENFKKLGLKKLYYSGYNINEPEKNGLYRYDGTWSYKLSDEPDFFKNMFEHFEEFKDAVVIDNPPFSRIAVSRNNKWGIINLLIENDIDFYLTSPITLMSKHSLNKYFIDNKIKLICQNSIKFSNTIKLVRTCMCTNISSVYKKYIEVNERRKLGKGDYSKGTALYNVINGETPINYDFIKDIPVDDTRMLAVPITAMLNTFNFDDYDVFGSMSYIDTDAVEKDNLIIKIHRKLGNDLTSETVYNDNGVLKSKFLRVYIKKK